MQWLRTHWHIIADKADDVFYCREATGAGTNKAMAMARLTRGSYLDS